jgi:hypothetical protein
MSGGLLADGGMSSLITMDCVTSTKLLQESVTLYVLVIVSGHDRLSDMSDIKVTMGLEQLSDASLTTLLSGVGIFSVQLRLIFSGLLAVGGISSLMIMF